MQIENLREWVNGAHSGTDRLGVLGLYVFALFAWLGSAGAYLGLSLMLMAFVLDWRNAWTVIKHDRFFVIFLIFVLYVYVRVVFTLDEIPQTTGGRWEDANAWATLWLFPLVAWWAQGSIKRIINILGLAWIGLVLGVLRKADWSQWQALLEGGRSGFGMTPLGTALLSGVAVMGLALLAPRLWGDPQNRAAFIMRTMLWLTVLFACLFVLIVTQSRAVWALVAVVLPLTMLLRVQGSVVTEYIHDHRVTAGVSLLVVVLMVGVFAHYAEPIKKRLFSEQKTIEIILARDWDSVPLTSIGARVHLNRFGWQRWLERPWFGWGPSVSATRGLTQNERSLKRFVDLHNSYLEVLVRLGLAGALLFGLAVIWVLRAMWLTYRKKIMPRDLFVFFSGAFMITAAWALIDFRMIHMDFRLYTILFGGLMYTFYITDFRERLAHERRE